MNLNIFVLNLKASVSSFYKENNFKPCLTKQLLDVSKLWCEQGIRCIEEHNVSTFFYPIRDAKPDNLPK